MVIAGLTGGIATGKSTVSRFLANMGATIIDADKIAYDAVLKEKPAWHKIIEVFGKDILLENSEIDRKKLGDIVFNSAEKKHELNCIVHPEVFMEMDRLIKNASANPNAVIILDVPLLIESGMNKDLDDVILVYVPESLQIKRLMARDGISRESALARICSQMPIEEKRRYADIIIDNSGNLGDTMKLADEAYLKLSGKIKS